MNERKKISHAKETVKKFGFWTTIHAECMFQTKRKRQHDEYKQSTINQRTKHSKWNGKREKRSACERTAFVMLWWCTMMDLYICIQHAPNARHTVRLLQRRLMRCCTNKQKFKRMHNVENNSNAMDFVMNVRVAFMFLRTAQHQASAVLHALPRLAHRGQNHHTWVKTQPYVHVCEHIKLNQSSTRLHSP